MKRSIIVVAAGVVIALSGCRTTPRPTTQPANGTPPGMTPFLQPGVPSPGSPAANPFAPQGAVPFNPQQTPGGAAFVPQGPVGNPGVTAPFIPPGAGPGQPVPGAPGASANPMFPSASNFAPGPVQVDYRWQPGAGQPPAVFLMPPEPIIREERKYSPTPEPPRIRDGQETARLYAPEPVRDLSGFSAAPRNVPMLPVGIPQFARVVDRVAAGLRPSLDEGLDWLQANGYRTVFFVRAPGDDDSADRKQVEKRGMTYLSMEASPDSLSRERLEAFNRVVSDSANYPLFVYDRDGSLAGGLWYLHFRTAEQLPDDAARLRAGALGLREDRDGAHRLMWLGIQKFLADR